MRALVIVDMLEDFVHGALANPRADSILDPLQRLLAQERAVRRVANTDVRVLAGENDLVNPERAQTSIEIRAVERAVRPLRELELSRTRARLELADDFRTRGSRHRVRTPDRKLGVARLVCVVREDDRPPLGARIACASARLRS